ncbi:MAG: rhomboid family intramembrane serine protease [Gammaproteobacteria bacterium]|nr:rhomboid family intramembrane serine protease [Gammaproteobacteria bacterium]
MDAEETGWTLVGSSISHKAIIECELVLTATGIDTRIERNGARWLLFARSEMEHAARQQLEAYRKENKGVKRERAPSPSIDKGFVGCAIYVAIVWTVWILESLGLLGEFSRNGAMWAYAVREQGEWWRTLTALTLHGDAAHLVGNTAFGVIFGIIAGRYYGSGLAWLLILLCGAAGNYLNALVQADRFVSIGASTAMFAAVGLIAGMFFRRRFISGRGWRYNAIPIVGAIGVFAFMGIGSERTDVVAHLTGLFCGLLAGVVVASFNLLRIGKSGQVLAGVTAIALLGIAIVIA